ncbi:MAG: hypothetical protein FJY56_20375 [Betaproteobacteria bacterium]|nr:hypothetical protein [Betaproteobacteria bacterium]
MRNVVLLGLLISAPALAQTDATNFPTRTIRIIVPQSPGASTDITARLMARHLNEVFKQPVVVVTCA